MNYKNALELDILKLGSIPVRTQDIPTAGQLILEIRQDLMKIRDAMEAEAASNNTEATA